MNSHLRALIAMSLPSIANMTTFPLVWMVFLACPVRSGCLSGDAVSVTALSAISTRYYSVARRRSPLFRHRQFFRAEVLSNFQVFLRHTKPVNSVWCLSRRSIQYLIPSYGSFLRNITVYFDRHAIHLAHRYHGVVRCLVSRRNNGRLVADYTSDFISLAHTQ